MPYQNAKWIEDDLVIEVGDFKNLEYTVLSVAKPPLPGFSMPAVLSPD